MPQNIVLLKTIMFSEKKNRIEQNRNSNRIKYGNIKDNMVKKNQFQYNSIMGNYAAKKTIK